MKVKLLGITGGAASGKTTIADLLINEFEEITRWPKKRSDKEYIIKYLSENSPFAISLSLIHI